MSILSIGILSAFSLGNQLSGSLPYNGHSNLIGSWDGIEIFQDAENYDGKTYYLPNNEQIIIDKDKIRIYYYPYSKIDEFKLSFNHSRLKYKIDGGYTESEYEIRADTLIMRMHFINKTFVKKYVRASFELRTIEELDEFGFNPSSLEHEFEIDTFHLDLKTGFTRYDSLSFTPFKFIQFLGDDRIKINRTEAVPVFRGYKTIRFTYQNQEVMMTVNHSEGTQHITLLPTTQCACTNVLLPYMNVGWANRIRKAIQDDIDWD